MAFSGVHNKIPTATYSNSRQDADLLDPADVISVPSYSRWFSWDKIHPCEERSLPEFFGEESASKNPEVYKYYRNAIVRSFRDNPTRRITYTEVRKSTIGDVGSIRRIFDFLQDWGLINHFPPPSKSTANVVQQDTPSVSTPATATATDVAAAAAAATNTSQPLLKKRVCSDCKCVCSFSCFTNERLDLTLCARCYVNQKPGVNISEFKRVEITDVVKSEWTDKETLMLLEAVMHYGDDWKKVSDRVPGKNDKDCVARFLKLPFGDQFAGAPESADKDHESDSQDSSFSNKRMRLTPLEDSSNPIMAQAAFLSALVGPNAAEVAAQAAIKALSDPGTGINKENPKSAVSGGPERPETSNGMDDSALNEAQLLLDKEEKDLEKSVSDIIAQTKEIKEKIVRFEKLDFEVEKEWQHMQQLKDNLYGDQLSLLFYEAYAERSGNSIVEID